MKRQWSKQDERDREARRSLEDQLKFRPQCILSGLHHGGMCAGPLTTFSPQGHGLCQAHQEKLKQDKSVTLDGSFRLEYVEAPDGK